MKFLIALFLIFASHKAMAVNTLILPINPTPMTSTHCQQVGNGITCTNGVQCQIQNTGSFKNIQCSNRLSCTVNQIGNISCNDGSFCQVQGMKLLCHNSKLNCTVTSPTNFFCHL